MNQAEEIQDAIRTLQELKRNDPVIQRGRSGELIRSFKTFWDSKPDEAQFFKVCEGLLFTHVMIYYMIEHPVWKDKDVMIVQEPVAPLASPPPPTPAPVQQRGKKR